MNALLLPIVALLASLPPFALAPLAPTAPPDQTPAERAIAQAERMLAQSPRPRAADWSELALALARRARETADPGFYTKAEAAIARSLELSPGNLEALKIKAWVLLGKHEFEEARGLARELNAKAPDDVIVYGFLVDANAELGRYDEAEEAAQWMLDLRPGNLAGLTRAAYLRELFGDVEGALDLFAQAFEQALPAETEDRAWILVQMAHLHTGTGRREVAEALLDEAFALFPDYHYALAQLARVRAGQGRQEEAVAALEKRYRLAPHPENLYDLAVALRRAGQEDRARKAFAEFEAAARAEASGPDNANRELVFYYADDAGRPDEALRLAEKEVARRRDVRSLDAHAWALYRSGRALEARAVLEQALALGIREAPMLHRAGVIAAAAGDSSAASRYFSESLRVDAASEVSAEARKGLAEAGGA